MHGCVCGWVGRMGCGDGDVVFVVDYVVIDVVIVAICVGCDGVSHGEML